METCTVKKPHFYDAVQYGDHSLLKLIKFPRILAKAQGLCSVPASTVPPPQHKHVHMTFIDPFCSSITMGGTDSSPKSHPCIPSVIIQIVDTVCVHVTTGRRHSVLLD